MEANHQEADKHHDKGDQMLFSNLVVNLRIE